MTDILITLLGMAVLVCVWVMLYDSNRFVVRRFTMTDSRIKHPCKAVFLTDLHNKCYGKKNELLLEAIRGENPDLVLIAGDILTAKPGVSMEPALNLLKELAGKYPVFYANGNHEHRLKLYPDVYGDMARRYGEELGKLGIEPMVNSHAFLPEFGIAVYGAEIHEDFYQRFSLAKMPPEYLAKTLGQAPGEYFVVLLAHNPDYFPEYAAWGADLTLSGHIHGGMARVPFWGKGFISPSWHLFPKYDGGIFRERKSVMVLSRGLGNHTVPVRLFNPAELWTVEFCPQDSALENRETGTDIAPAPD